MAAVTLITIALPLMRSSASAERPRRIKAEKSQPSQPVARSSSDRLHLALGVAIAAVTLIAIALPLTHSSASAERSPSPVLVVSDGFSSAVQSQAQTLVNALAQVGPVATVQGPSLSQGLDGFPGGTLVPRPLLVAAAGLLVQGALAGPEGQPGLAIELQDPVRFTLHEGGFSSAVFSTRPTVGAALVALGAEYDEYDIVLPAPDTPLTGGLHVFVERAITVELTVGARKPADVHTQAETVAGLLDEEGVKLSEGDSVTPKPSTALSDGMSISVTLVREKTEVEETPIPFRTIYRDDPSLAEGQSGVVQFGVDGYVVREYAVVYENGEEVSRELLSEVVVEPDYEIIVQGTAVVAAAVAAPSAPSGDPNCARTLTVWATWYTAASAGGYGITATGTTVQKGTVAVDPSVIPLGTRMYIPGYGHGIAEDTGGAIIGNIIDLGYGPNDVWDWGSRYVDICIL